MAENGIELDEFLAKVRQEIKRFEEFWRSGMDVRPDMFPARMLEGDWREQLVIHDDDVGEE